MISIPLVTVIPSQFTTGKGGEHNCTTTLYQRLPGHRLPQWWNSNCQPRTPKPIPASAFSSIPGTDWHWLASPEGRLWDGVKVQEFYYGVSWDHFLRKKRDDGRIGPREKSSCDSALPGPAMGCAGTSKAGVALRAVLSWAERQAFISQHCPVTGYRSPRKGSGPSVSQLSSADAIPTGGWPLRAFCWQHSRQLGEEVFHPWKGFWVVHRSVYHTPYSRLS